MESQKMTPLLRFPQYSEVWIKKKIEESIDFLSGHPFNGEDISEDSNGAKLMRGVNISEGFIRHSPEIDRYYIGDTLKLKKYFLNTGDLIIGMDGSKVGKNSSLVDDSNANSLLVQRVARLREKPSTSLSFIYQHINSLRFHKYVDEVKTSSGIPHISASQIKGFVISFPSLPEQQNIATFLTSVDTKLTQLKKKKNLLEQYKKGAMQKIFSRKIRFKDDKGKEFPEWEEKRLEEIADINPKNEPLPNSFIYIDLESVVGGVLLKEEKIEKIYAPSRAQRLLKKGDVLYQMVRPYQKNNLYFNKEGDYVASTGYAQIRTNGSSKYLFHYFHYQKFVDKVIERCTGTSYPSINSTDLSNISISIPTLAEQTKIANFLSALDEKINHCSTQIEKTEQWKKGLIQKMFC